MGEKDLRSRSGSLISTDPRFVVNELLAFVFDELKRSALVDIKNRVLCFYGPPDINEAKHLLWESYSTNLPPYSARIDTSKRSAAEADVEDMMNAIAKIDSLCQGNEDPPTIFVARRLRNVPPPEQNPPAASTCNNCAPEIPMILQRLESIEEHMKRDRISHMAPYKPMPMHMHMPQGIVGNDVDDGEEPAGFTDLQKKYDDEEEDFTFVKVPGSKQTYSLAAGSKFQQVNAQQTHQGQQRHQKVQKAGLPPKRPFRKRQEKVVVGTAKSTTMRAGKRRVELFVYRIDREVLEKEIVDFIEAKEVHVVEVERLSPDDRVSHSYRILIECSDPTRPLNDPDFWPENVCCRRFRRRRQNTQADNDVQRAE